MLPKLLESPFQTLGCTVQQVVKALTYAEVTFEWEYMIEPETGLRILRAEKDPEALSHVREIADRLFE